MPLETGTYISDLVATNPLGSDQKSTADDHLRLIKSTIKASFPNVNGAVNPTPTQFNYLVGVTSAIQTQIDSKGAVAGQTWTGTHTFPTQAAGDNSTKVATTAYADRKGDITGQTWTGTHIFPTQSPSDNSTKVATTAYADNARINGNRVLLRSQTASAVAAVDFVHGTGGVVIDSTYDLYILEIIDLLPATNGSTAFLRTSSDAGATWAGASSNYGSVTAAGNATTETTAIVLSPVLSGASGSVSNGAGHRGLNCEIRVFKPSATTNPAFAISGMYVNTLPVAYPVFSGAWRTASAAINGLRVLFSSGNITSGTINLYGVKK